MALRSVETQLQLLAQDDRQIPVTELVRSPEIFCQLLKFHRQRHNLSQEKLAEAAGLDHSLVSRLESGNRAPTFRSIMFLAEAMELSKEQHDQLLMAAGFCPVLASSMLQNPDLAILDKILSDPTLPASQRQAVEQMLSGLVQMLTN